MDLKLIKKNQKITRGNHARLECTMILTLVTLCRAPLHEECPQHHGYKGDPGVTPGLCGAIGERAQVM